ncbi:MAG: acyl-CoA dehydrogenase [Alphaproteobacteria bacterium]|nr:acyl-CoA dehydrogenase [Alphaproteobacteria bacterium]
MNVATTGVTAARPSLAELLERAKAMVPRLRAEALATERRRTLSAEIMQELFANGFLRIFQPVRFGGYEMDWGTQYEIGRVLARGCPSTAWIVGIVGTHSAYVARFPAEAQEEVWAKSSDILISTGSVQKTGTVTKVPGGYRLNGTWGFASGVDHSAWGMVAGRIEGEAEGRQFLFPRVDFVVDDTWHVAGMKGTGTKDIDVKNAFVPDHRAVLQSVFNGVNPPGAAIHQHYLYRGEFRPFTGSGLLGPIMGASEGAYDEYVVRTRVKHGAIFRDKVAENPTVQMRVAEAAAELDAARLLADRQNAQLHHKGKAGESFSDGERVMLQRDRAYITKLCLQSCERLVRMMGALGVFDDNPVQRAYRDLHVMSTQIGVNWDVNITPFGKWTLGLAVTPPGPTQNLRPKE